MRSAFAPRSQSKPVQSTGSESQMRLSNPNFTRRLVALVAVVSVGATLLSSILLSWSNYNAMLAETEIEGRSVARLLAKSASLARELPTEVEDIIAKHMIVSAELLAEFVAAAEKAGMTAAEINARLDALTERTVLDEFWVTDEKGRAYLHKGDSGDFTFSPSAAQQPQAHEFWDLLTGAKSVVVQQARRREIDDKSFKYVGVKGLDKPRIVQVGYEARFFEALSTQIGLPRAIENLLGSGEIDAIFVFNRDSQLIARPKHDAEDALTERETTPIRSVIQSGSPRVVSNGGSLSVISPIDNGRGETIGAALVRIPTARLRGMIDDEARIAFAIAVATTLVGAFVAAWLARRQTAPVVQLTNAARNFELRRYTRDELSDVERRDDELGQLARVFRKIAEDFLARERKLDMLVQERTAALEEKNSELERLSSRLSKYLSPQIYGNLFRDKNVSAISAKRKKLTVFFSDVVGFSELAERLESEDITRMLNDFLDEMARIALAHGATIDKYIGDAVMIFFGDPETRGVKEDALACVTMALEMQAMTRRLARRWRDQGLDHPFEIRIGVNTGYCTVGDFGSQERMDYTIIGHQVNIAARLEQAATPGAVLISHDTMTLVQDAFELEEQAPLTVKGHTGPIQTYVVLREKEASAAAVLREERDGLTVDVDLARADRAEAVRVLESMIERLRVAERVGDGKEKISSDS